MANTYLSPGILFPIPPTINLGGGFEIVQDMRDCCPGSRTGPIGERFESFTLLTDRVKVSTRSSVTTSEFFESFEDTTTERV